MTTQQQATMRELGLFGTYVRAGEPGGALQVLYKESREAQEELVGWLTSSPKEGFVPVSEPDFGFHWGFNPEGEPDENKLYLPRVIRLGTESFNLKQLASKGQLYYRPNNKPAKEQQEEELPLTQAEMEQLALSAACSLPPGRLSALVEKLLGLLK